MTMTTQTELPTDAWEAAERIVEQHNINDPDNSIFNDILEAIRGAQDAVDTMLAVGTGQKMKEGTTMTTQTEAVYKIENPASGLVLGVYPAGTAEAALDAMARDNGYADRWERLRTIKCDVSAIRATRLAVGDRFKTDGHGTERFDTGTLLEIKGKTARIGWDSGVQTVKVATEKNTPITVRRTETGRMEIIQHPFIDEPDAWIFASAEEARALAAAIAQLFGTVDNPTGPASGQEGND